MPSFQAMAPFKVVGEPNVREYEDTLQLVIELDHVLTKPERAKLSALYDRWCRDIRAESKRADDDLDDEVDFHRFEPLFLGDRAVSGGASRFISASESSALLIQRLAKLRGVTRVTFGEPPDTGTPLEAAPDDEPPAKLAKLELYDDENARMATLGFAITLFSSKPLQQAPKAVLACWNAFRALMGTNRLTLWGTETTAPMNKKPVTASTLELLDKWLAKNAPKRGYLAIELGDGATYMDAPRWQFNVWSGAGAHEGHFVRLALPYHIALSRADELAELTRTLFATNAFRSAQAGPAWNTGCFSRSHRAGNPHEHAVALSAKYPGIDLLQVVNDAHAVKSDGLKGVGWLTLLDAKLVAEVGGAHKLPRSITLSSAGRGTMFRCGATPTLDARGGERELVNKLGPLIARTLPRTRWLHVASDDEVKSLGFRLRLALWPELALCTRASSLGDQLLQAVRESPAAARAAWAKCARALRELAAIKLGATPIDHRAARAELVQHRISDIFTKVGYAHVAAKPPLALWLSEQALRLPGAPAALYADLRVRQDPDYVLGGALPAAIAAGDHAALRRLVGPAAARAKEQPDIHHALARAYVVLGDHPRALEHVASAIATYPDAKAMRDETALAPLRGPDFKALFRTKPKRSGQ